MAISTERQLFVKQKAGTFGVDPSTSLVLKALFRYWAEHKQAIDMEYVPFADLTADTVIADAACKALVYYAKKQNTATDAFFKAVDHATTAAGTTFALCAELNVGNDVFIGAYPEGLAMASGITLVSSTTDTGSTDTSSGDGPDGFVIITDP